MNPQETQPTQSQSSPDEAAASLAFATSLNQPNGSQEPQNASGQQQTQEMLQEPSQDLEELKSQFSDEFATMRKDLMKEVKSAIKGEIGNLRDEIKSALDEEDETTKDTK